MYCKFLVFLTQKHIVVWKIFAGNCPQWKFVTLQDIRYVSYMCHTLVIVSCMVVYVCRSSLGCLIQHSGQTHCRACSKAKTQDSVQEMQCSQENWTRNSTQPWQTCAFSMRKRSPGVHKDLPRLLLSREWPCMPGQDMMTIYDNVDLCRWRWCSELCKLYDLPIKNHDLPIKHGDFPSN